MEIVYTLITLFIITLFPTVVYIWIMGKKYFTILYITFIFLIRKFDCNYIMISTSFLGKNVIHTYDKKFFFINGEFFLEKYRDNLSIKYINGDIDVKVDGIKCLYLSMIVSMLSKKIDKKHYKIKEIDNIKDLFKNMKLKSRVNKLNSIR